MSKTEINNEIILMRKNVEQARVQIIKKLTRDILKLQKKKGTDIQKAKNLRKAERIAAEILSIKKLKKDEITKYVLINNVNLKEIFNDKNSKPLVRMMARIGNHKKFNVKITEFKNKYPNFMEFLGPGKKKKAQLEKQEKKIIKGNRDFEDISISNVKNIERNKIKNKKLSQSKEENVDHIVDKKSSNSSKDQNKKIHSDGKTCSSKGQITDESGNENTDDNEEINKNKNIEKIKCIKNKAEQNNKEIKLVTNNEAKNPINKQKIPERNLQTLENRSKVTKIISKQAIVKKFTDILKDVEIVNNVDKDKEIDNESFISNMKIEKEVDPFFVTGDEEANYLSVALPKNKLNYEEDKYKNNHKNAFNKRKFSREQNDNFFTKVPKYKSNDKKFDFNKMENERKNFKFHKKDNVNSNLRFKKYNDEDNYNLDKSQKAKINFEENNKAILHPSWEAKKKQQEILKQGFKGKKIVFDDGE